jgi:hypothetical protein
MIAIDPLEWPGVNVAFLVSFFATIIMTLGVILYGKRRPVGKPVSWGEAMLAATYVFALMFLAFGVVQHQWIDHADKDLGWSRDRIVMGPAGILESQATGGFMPFTITYEAIRDIIVVVLHAVYFGMIIFMWSWWQKRGQVKTAEIEVSSFGRPLVKKA